MSTTNESVDAITLSDTGLSALITKKEIATIDMTLNGDKIEVALKPTGRFVLVKEDNSNDARDYVNKLIEFADKNKIIDTDKVFFVKNSDFPRTTWNRYSTEAKRGEKPLIATKHVINPKFNFGYSYHKYREFNGYAVMANITTGQRELIAELSSRVAKANGLRDIQVTLSSGGWYSRNEAESKIIDFMKKSLGVTDSDRNLAIAIGYNQKDSDTLDFLVAGHDYTKLTTDTCANEYINKFKTTLDEPTYKMLLTTMSKGENNVTMGIKLLENMNLTNCEPYFYGLLANAFSENSRVIRANTAYRGIGFKNLRTTYNLDPIVAIDYSYRESLSMLESIYNNRMTTEAHKKVFRGLVEENIHKQLKNMLGNEVYNFIKFNKDEDDITEDTTE
jgi:hypothetical protein